MTTRHPAPPSASHQLALLEPLRCPPPAPTGRPRPRRPRSQRPRPALDERTRLALDERTRQAGRRGLAAARRALRAAAPPDPPARAA